MSWPVTSPAAPSEKLPQYFPISSNGILGTLGSPTEIPEGSSRLVTQAFCSQACLWTLKLFDSSPSPSRSRSVA